jgi:hypothetical protein
MALSVHIGPREGGTWIMFTLNRLSTIGIAAGLVVVGCASPTDETPLEPIDETSAAITAATDETSEQAPEMIVDESALSASDIANAMASETALADTEEENIDSKSDAIIMGPFGGFGGLGFGRVGFGGFGVPFGGLGFGRVGFGGFGVPGLGFGGFGMPGLGFGGFGMPGIGFGGFGMPFGGLGFGRVGFGGFGMPGFGFW